MLHGRRAAIAAAVAIAAVAVVTAGCGGGSTSSALQLDPVAAAATKTQQAGAARIRFMMAVNSPQLPGKSFRLRGTGAIDGASAEMSFKLASMLHGMGLPSGAGSAALKKLAHGSIKEIVLEQQGDYVIFMNLGSLAPKLPSNAWIKLDLSKLGKSAGVDLGKVMSGNQLDPSDVLSSLKTEGAKVQKLGSASIDGVATTRYHVRVNLSKALKSKGLTSPLFSSVAAQMKTASEDVWIGKDGLVRRIQFSYDVPRGATPMRLAMTMDIYDYGAHISIAAPPSNEVFDMTQFAKQGLASATH